MINTHRIKVACQSVAVMCEVVLIKLPIIILKTYYRE